MYIELTRNNVVCELLKIYECKQIYETQICVALFNIVQIETTKNLFVIVTPSIGVGRNALEYAKMCCNYRPV